MCCPVQGFVIPCLHFVTSVFLQYALHFVLHNHFSRDQKHITGEHDQCFWCTMHCNHRPWRQCCNRIKNQWIKIYIIVSWTWCDVIKQNELQVCNNMLLVSKLLFHLHICEMSIITGYLSQVHGWWYIDLICKWCYCRVHKCFVSNYIDIMFEVKNNLKPVTCRHQLHSAYWSSHCLQISI